MIINKHYIQGILDATYEVYEIENGRIERDKDLQFTLVEKSNYIVILSTENETQLEEIKQKLIDRGITFSEFIEPDYGNQLTSIAISPYYSDDIGRIFSSLPLAGKESNNDTIKFTKWLKHLDNGTTHYNPYTKEETESIGFSPYDCFMDDVYTVEELYNKFKKLKNDE